MHRLRQQRHTQSGASAKLMTLPDRSRSSNGHAVRNTPARQASNRKQTKHGRTHTQTHTQIFHVITKRRKQNRPKQNVRDQSVAFTTTYTPCMRFLMRRPIGDHTDQAPCFHFGNSKPLKTDPESSHSVINFCPHNPKACFWISC